jgi:hypothetical protein
MAVQPFIRRGTRSNATARRLVATSTAIAPSVLRSTVEHDDIHQDAMRCFAMDDVTIAGIQIDAAIPYFYLVRSPKFTNRFYVLYRKAGRWLCSANDERVKAYCIQKVETYRAALKQAA